MSREIHFGQWRFRPDTHVVFSTAGQVTLEPGVARLLEYFLRHPGEVLSHDRLVEEVWEGRVVSDEAVRRAVSSLRRALAVDGEASPLQTVHKAGYLAEFQPPPRELEVDDQTAARRPPGMRLMALLGMLCVAGALLWLLNIDTTATDRPGTARPPNTIAVLPFEDIGTAANDEYLSEGIAEELLGTLGRYAGFQVTARSSSFQFRGKQLDPREIGEQLGVRYLIEGSVRRDGEQLRVSATLIDAESGFLLWSQVYDRTLADLFELQIEIATAVARQLRVVLVQGGGESLLGRGPGNADAHLEDLKKTLVTPHVPDIEAYEAYLRGRHLMHQRTQTSIASAILEFKRAVSLDPDYALAYAELSLATRRGAFSGKMTNDEAIALAAPYAERAMQLDPNLPQAHAATGYVWAMPGTIATAVGHFRRAVELNPNYAEGYLFLGFFLELIGEYHESFSMQQKALQLDPLSLPANDAYASGLLGRNRLQEADRQLEKLQSLAPHYYYTSLGLQMRRSLGGQWANGLLIALEGLRYDESPSESNIISALAVGFAVIGLPQEALALPESPPTVIFTLLDMPERELAAREEKYLDERIGRPNLGLAMAYRGDYARARAPLEASWRQLDHRVTRLVFLADAAAALLAIQRAAGEGDANGALLAALRDNVRRYDQAGITRGEVLWNPYYENGLVNYLAGNHEQGLASIARAVEDGYFVRAEAAYLKVLYDDPRFASILAVQESRRVRERDKFLAVVCGDNPYQDVWRPQPETCRSWAD